MLIAAPLLVVSRPLVTFLWALPFEWRRTVGTLVQEPRRIQSPWLWLTAPFDGMVDPRACDLGLGMRRLCFRPTLHSDLSTRHSTLVSFLSALLFWWALLYAHGRRLTAAACSSSSRPPCTPAFWERLLTFAPRLWYPAYSQHDAGLGTFAAAGPADWRADHVGSGEPCVSRGGVGHVRCLDEGKRRPAREGYPCAISCWLPQSLMLRRSSCWLQPEQAQAEQIARATTGGSAARGSAAIARYGCGSCHIIPGVSGASGLAGPPLSGIGESNLRRGRIAKHAGKHDALD